jgi:hypothetical protein
MLRRNRELTFEERTKLKQKIDKAQRKKLKLKKGSQTARGAPREMMYLPFVALELADDEPLRALSAAVEVTRVAELIK